MISITLKDKTGAPIKGKVDHEKEMGPLIATGVEAATLGIKEYLYHPGDFIEVRCDESPCYIYAQLEETLAPSLLFLPDGEWIFKPLLAEDRRKASIDTSFLSHRHCMCVRKAFPHEIQNYQNLSLNTHDQKEFLGAFPYAKANVETRNEVVFFAKNAVDGKWANFSHGSYPFTSWGINKQADAALTIDFGREVEVDWIRLLLRADYPHDSHWTQGTVAFSDGEEKVFETKASLEFQDFRFPSKVTSIIVLKNLVKADDESPFPALTQIEVYGKNR